MYDIFLLIILLCNIFGPIAYTSILIVLEYNIFSWASGHSLAVSFHNILVWEEISSLIICWICWSICCFISTRGSASVGATGTKPHLTFGGHKERVDLQKSSLYIAFIIYLKKEGNSVNKSVFEILWDI
jgi:hypothetical protein